ncbi:MAG: flagellar protein FlgN [Woeseiaceae bacterium]|nr:flagellar protein FlgN [Woeseiaceae bacterium]
MNNPAAGSDRERCRDGLASIIDGLATLGCRLESLLEAEEAALRAADVEAIETLGQEKSKRVESMDALEAERRTLLDGAGFGSGSADLERCIDWCNGDPRLIGRWNELLATTARCRELNQRNAAVGRVRHEQIRAALALLSGGVDGGSVYDPSGRDTGTSRQREIGLA